MRLDGDRTSIARHTVPAYPFDPPDPSEFPDRLYPHQAEAAVAALAIMAEEWQSEPARERSRPDRDAVPAGVRTLLGRYGRTAHYWTNARAAASDLAPELIAMGLQGTESHGFLTSEVAAGWDRGEVLCQCRLVRSVPDHAGGCGGDANGRQRMESHRPVSA